MLTKISALYPEEARWRDAWHMACCMYRSYCYDRIRTIARKSQNAVYNVRRP